MQDPDKNKPTPPGGNESGPSRNFIIVLVVSLVLTLLINSMFTSFNTRQGREIPYTGFLDMVEEDKVKSIIIQPNQIIIWPKTPEGETPANYYYTGIVSNDDELLPLLREHDVQVSAEIPQEDSLLMTILFTWIIPVLLIYLVLNWLMGSRMRSMGGLGQSKAKEFDMETSTGITFEDVAGQDEAKESLMEIVDVLKNPRRYELIGAKTPKGALLVGPPGTGKTLMAKAVAGEAGVPFFSIAGSDFVEMFVGMGASRVRSLFKQASAKAPCIIFIDEIDTIGKRRDNQLGSNDEREQTLNSLLAEMDGFDPSRSIVVLAATNRPEILDKALLRPGRFDRTITVTTPDLKGREDILRVHLRNVKQDLGIDVREIALMTSGASGADLANIVNEAALRAVRFNREKVCQEDLAESVELVIVGMEKKNSVMTQKERELVAYHEIGHAMVAAYQKDSQPIQKITIIPRTSGALGYTMQVPEEERFLLTRDELLSEIATMLGGRAAENVKFNLSTTGASNDIIKATQVARKMVTMYGMSEEYGMMALESAESQYLDGRPVSLVAEETTAGVDRVVRQIIDEAFQKAKHILGEHQDVLDAASQHLLEREVITGEEFMRFIREAESGTQLAEPQALPEAAASAEPAAEDPEGEKQPEE